MCGTDGVYQQGMAVIEGKTVIVSSPQVANPVKVRYGWLEAFSPSLFNAEGLPASPFSTGAAK